MCNRINPLTEEQLNQLPQTTGNRIVRFMARVDPLQPRRPESVNICTGITEGGNIINQYVYWDRPTEYVAMVLEFLRQNNPGTTINVIVR